MVPGIGSSLRSSFLDESCYDDFAAVGAAECCAMCGVLREDLELAVGGSSGSVISAMVAAERRKTLFPVCLCPDNGTKYLDTFYSDRWLADIGLLGETVAAIGRLRADGLRFRWERPDAGPPPEPVLHLES